MQTRSKERPTSRDLITIAVFSVVFSIVVFACSMTIGMVPLLYPFLVPIGLIPCGIVWAYLRVKVPKAFSSLIQCVILALLLFLIGSGWFITVGILAGGIAAELISSIGRYKSYLMNTLAYALFGVGFHLGGFAIIMLARDYYYNFAITNGMDAAYMDTLMGFMSWQVLAFTTALAVVGAVVGMWLGKTMLKKHFVKAGIA